MSDVFVPRVRDFLREQLCPVLVADAFSGSGAPLTSAAWVFGLASKVLERCESPIEQLLAAAFMVRWGFDFTLVEHATYVPVGSDGAFSVTTQDRILADGGYDLVTLDGQWKMRAPVVARIDFVIRSLTDNRWRVAVECDGHNFHERTPEQAERDRSRDRALTADGWTVLRFTGRELWRDPFVAVNDVEATIERVGGRGRR